ncbi:MAG: hypothetical protein RLZZ122_1139 [Actinomycetota bacterium]
MNLDNFWYGILIVVALLFFGWRFTKSIRAIRSAKASGKPVPFIEWVYLPMGLFLIGLFVLNALGLINA